ncbi:MAG: hypothetical protein SGJ04_08360 [Bacteroidota bacterium]|nr:hypothetical protein [Bacteroidota bacterium]
MKKYLTLLLLCFSVLASAQSGFDKNLTTFFMKEGDKPRNVVKLINKFSLESGFSFDYMRPNSQINSWNAWLVNKLQANFRINDEYSIEALYGTVNNAFATVREENGAFSQPKTYIYYKEKGIVLNSSIWKKAGQSVSIGFGAKIRNGVDMNTVSSSEPEKNVCLRSEHTFVLLNNDFGLSIRPSYQIDVTGPFYFKVLVDYSRYFNKTKTATDFRGQDFFEHRPINSNLTLNLNFGIRL